MTTSEADVCATALRFAAQGALRYLETSQAWQQMTLAEGQFHTGDDPIVADSEAHVEFERSLRAHPAWHDLHIWGVVGEENIREVPKVYRVGTRVIVLDSLDGSTMWAMMRQGYCVAALSLLAGQDGLLKLECAIVATPVHTFTLDGDGGLRFGPTFEGPELDSLMLSTVPESPLLPPSLAINGFKHRDRPFILGILSRLSDWNAVTIGGNPTNPYVVMGSLTATVNTRYQCTWDALGILMCTATDAVVGDCEGTAVAGPAFRDLFNRLLLEGNVKCVPPMIVAKNLDRFQEVAAAVTEIPFTNHDPF